MERGGGGSLVGTTRTRETVVKLDLMEDIRDIY